MRVNVAVPEKDVSKPILNSMLEATTKVDEALIRQREVPLFRQAVNRVRWKPEPPGDEHFDHAGIVLVRGWGDCDDLAPWHAASLRATGQDPNARAIVKRSGHRKWHAVVERGNGRIEDPSREAGMGRNRGVNGAVVRPIPGSSVVGVSLAIPRLAVRPVRDPVSSEIEAWQARADLPWHIRPGRSKHDVAMASLHASPVATQAIAGAVHGAMVIGEASMLVGEETLIRAEAIGMACDGATWDDIAEVYGDDIADETAAVVGGLFKKIGKAFKKVGKGIVKAVTSKAGRALISNIPFVGPSAATALDFAGPTLNKLASGKGGKKGRKKATKAQIYAMLPPHARAAMKRAALKGAGAKKVKRVSKVRPKRRARNVAKRQGRVLKAVVYIPAGS